MKILKRTYLLLLLLFMSCNTKKDVSLEAINFNEEWFFKMADSTSLAEKAYLKNNDFSNWDSISLPHTPKIEPKIVNNQWQGISWYAKKFNLGTEMNGKKLFLKFEGAMNIAEVWVNNKKLIEHHGGYLPFVVEFSEVALFDNENTVKVKLNNFDNPFTGPKPLKTLDFNTYGGIYRNVWLIAKNPLHITDPIFANKTASGGIFVSYPKVDKQEATINVKTHAFNQNKENQSFVIKNTLLKNEKEILSVTSETFVLTPNQDQQFSSDLMLKNPELWSPSAPNLYHLKTEIIQNGVVVDKEITRIGIKHVAFKGQDLYWNGEKTFLRGVNRHQEYPYVGYALSDNANYRDAKKIKDAGFDYVRLSHYPQSTAFMNACDELGLVTIDAILGWQYFSEDKAFQENVFQSAKELIRRDRNHASVLAWEVSLNESWMPEPFIDSLTKIAKEEYPGNQCFTAGWQSYGYDIYLQARQHRLEHYDPTIKKPYNVSEYGDWEYYAMNAGLNQTSWSNLLPLERSSRQLRSVGEKGLLQQATNLQEAHNDNLQTPAYSDGYWVMFDYNRGYADDLEASGIMDIFRIAKPSYYFYQSQRSANENFGKPMIYIANQWKKDSPLEVRIFSNCDEVELFLNGKSLGKQKPDSNRISSHLKHPPFTFHLSKYVAGTLEAKGFLNNKMVANHKVISPQNPTKIKLEVDLSGKNIDPKQNDMVFIYASLVDDNGTVITNISDKITFNIKGNAVLIGENPVDLEAGVATILLKTSQLTEKVEILAEAKSLKFKTKISVKKQ